METPERGLSQVPGPQDPRAESPLPGLAMSSGPLGAGARGQGRLWPGPGPQPGLTCALGPVLSGEGPCPRPHPDERGARQVPKHCHGQRPRPGALSPSQELSALNQAQERPGCARPRAGRRVLAPSRAPGREDGWAGLWGSPPQAESAQGPSAAPTCSLSPGPAFIAPKLGSAGPQFPGII